MKRLRGSLRASGYPADNPKKDWLRPGLRRRAWVVGERIGERTFGRRLDTDTRYVDPRHFDADLVWYVPSGWWYLVRALRAVDLEAADVFVDFGAGKGRAVIQAAKHPVARVVGVEISPTLADIARENLRTVRPRLKCRDVEIITADAAEYAVPDDMTIAYLCHPFTGETFQRVLEEILASLDRRPRHLRLVYAVPVHHEDILATGRFRLVSSTRIRDAGTPQRLAIYEAQQAPAGLVAIPR